MFTEYGTSSTTTIASVESSTALKAESPGPAMSVTTCLKLPLTVFLSSPQRPANATSLPPTGASGAASNTTGTKYSSAGIAGMLTFTPVGSTPGAIATGTCTPLG